VDAIYSMIGNMLELPKDEDTPQKRVEKIFSNMDLVSLCGLKWENKRLLPTRRTSTAN
jgi:hypothetical protein